MATQISSTPVLSVVIPVYNVTPYLDECLDSVFQQGFEREQLEVLLVNDGSTDGSGLIAEKWLAQHSNIRLINQTNAGLSAARNKGMLNATGEFIAFLDSDDIVPTGAYQDMIERLRSSGSDFITCPAYRFSRTNRVAWPFRRNSDLFIEDLTGISLEQHPEFIRDFTAWNKIYRRAFILGSGVRFPEGRIYEDVATSPILYHLAKSFDVYSKPGYYWRVTPGGITQTINSAKADDRLWALEHIQSYFNAVSVSQAVMDALNFAIIDYNLRWIFLEFPRFDSSTQESIVARAQELLKTIDPRVVNRVQSPLREWALLAKDGRLRELTRELSVQQELPDLSVNRSTGKLAKAALHFRTFRELQRSKFARRRRDVQRQAKHLAIYLLLRPLVRLTPLNENLIVVSNYWGQKFSQSDGPAAICIELIKSNPDVRCAIFASKNHYSEIKAKVKSLVSDPRRVKVIRNDTFRYYIALWRAKYLFNDVNFQVAFRVDRGTALRPGQIEVQTTHGIPLKKMGLDSDAAIPPGEVRKFQARSKRYTHLVAPSPLVAETFAASHGVKPQILKTGLPQNDQLFSSHDPSKIRMLKDSFGLDPERRIVLYAPTFRGATRSPFPYLLDFHKLHDALGDNYQFVVKTHPFNHTHLSMIDFGEMTNFTKPAHPSPFVHLLGEVRKDDHYQPVVNDPSLVHPAETVVTSGDINDLMLVADIVITDYSSLMFSYMHLNKPLVLFTPDIEHYNATRGSYWNIDGIAPGAVTKSTDEVVAAIRLAANEDEWNDKFSERIKSFREQFLIWETGNASRKILAELGLITSDVN